MGTNIFKAALTLEADPQVAIEAIAHQIKTMLGSRACHLAILFVSEGYPEYRSDSLLQQFRSIVQPEHLIGCNTSGVIGSDHEIEMKPAISVLAMHLPEVKLFPFWLPPEQIEQFNSGEDVIDCLDVYPTDHPKFICLGDPLTTDVRRFLNMFNNAYRQLPVVGGLASANASGIPNWLVLDESLYESGLVGMVMVGDITFETVVSQGCRPIGEPYIITKSEKNILHELAGKPPLQVLRELFVSLPAHDQALMQHALFVGLAMDENRQQLKRGDFLIRNILGADETSGAMSIGEMLDTGQTLQFQLRDKDASEDDLKTLLGNMKNELSDASGALLVSCLGRGAGLFGEPDHDIQMIQALRGPLPVAGFFANGEFGPVNAKNYVHGYTSSLTIFR
ncbi:MAG: hypothetical protein COV74_06210 [Candidatus Omnitrophica bacterium CG11_big_fil_rev_8_21_14_0_20_45_26]|uniref:Histidine kinase n=1 Tax=Candidatus Abzuiibacterium crystallinum TaxID=1974748 RepID=A0A2H0LNK2_9BACT|nr:MAG: hypothetical protein COV74_06210 [Candidatus Omnitrophica bacterium CG11_big_fil_rev_8_21_14_0_20_45_26]PIW65638.1 MAG: hypothetical protein COW12_00590 [Candidatus Omnitrophica bacterium CG12_big_fil_rev_8_21_14_0_65_45_16]